MSAFLIAIEGADGSGKTTQAEALHSSLQKDGYDAVAIQPVYELVNLFPVDIEHYVSPRRSATSSSKERSESNRISFLLVAMGITYSLLSFLWISFVYRNKVVVCDRYFYQLFFDLIGTRAKQLAAVFPSPDVTIILETDIDNAMKRLDEFDSSVQREYYEQVAAYYSNLSIRGTVQVVQANQNPKEVHKRIKKVVEVPETYRVNK